MRVLCLIAWICAPHSDLARRAPSLSRKGLSRRALPKREIAPDGATGSLRGNVSIRIVSAAARLPVVALDADELAIERAVEDGHPLAVEITPGLARIRLTRPARRGETRTIRIWYHAQPKRGMWFLPNGWWYTGFHTEAWLPCDASPADRSTFTFHSIVPAVMSLIGTGVETERARLPGDGDRERRTVVLDEPYPAYLVGAVAGPLRTSCIDAGAVRICASIDRPGQDGSSARAGDGERRTAHAREMGRRGVSPETLQSNLPAE